MFCFSNMPLEAVNNLGYRIVWSFLMARNIFRLVKCHPEVARAGKFGGLSAHHGI